MSDIWGNYCKAVAAYSFFGSIFLEFSNMGIRTFDRIPVLIEVEINCDNKVYKGTLMNLSESGMFIRTNSMPFPLQSLIEISMPMNEEMIIISGKLVREENIRGYYNGIGVELLNPPKNYIDFIYSLLTVL